MNIVNIKMLIRSANVSNNTLANLESRDVTLWVHDLPVDAEQRAAVIAFLGLPWRSIILEGHDNSLVAALEAASSVDDPLARKRGLVQIVDSDPSRIQLPPRCLPVYLLGGRQRGTGVSTFEDRLRRITMLEDLRRSGARELLIISTNSYSVLTDLGDLWSAGYRTQLTFVSDSPSVESELEQWFNTRLDVATVTLVRLPPQRLVQDILVRYWETYPADRHIIRMRDGRGQLHKVDVTTADEIERPILGSYTLVEERDLAPLSPQELPQHEFVDFFKNPESSWRPYAAALPWVRDSNCREKLRRCLRKLEVAGPEENCIAYITSEPGAGGTTLARVLAREFAREGYPVLVAKPFPFVPDALPVVNYLISVLRIFAEQTADASTSPSARPVAHSTNDEDSTGRRYETPWIVVFDTLHWQHRDTELLQFRNELARSGRPVCLLIVTGTALGLPFLSSPVFRKVSELNHAIQRGEARQLGQHLNTFLRYYGKARTEAQWDAFYEEHTVRYLDGIAAFWVTLSFWIQGQYDLSESIQQWIYTAFKEQGDDRLIQDAILQIAAMSSERLPLPQVLLPKTTGRWPVWQLLEDRVADLARIGLTQIVAQGERHWALVHDVLGRLLINALFYDYPTREAMGFSQATDPEHLRFLLLRGIAENPRLGERAYRSVGEDFATDIFKVDPAGGKSSFAVLWREVLDALDKMPQLLRDTSRVFRHHTAISRRRIAKLEPGLYGLEDNDRRVLLRRAIADVNYALTEIPYTGSEPDLNLLNSLAHAYFDLAEVEAAAGTPNAEVAELRRLATEATQKAYRESPNNSFVVETYVRSLLQGARDAPEGALEGCVKALGVLYATLHTNTDSGRAPQLGRLADQALEILLQQAPSETLASQPKNAIDVLVQAWLILAQDRRQGQAWSLTEVPLRKQEEALAVLAHQIGRGNLQVLHLRYDLTCNCYPYEYKKQIELLEPLRLSEYWLTPQLQLEYAILLFQVGRTNEGDRAFRSLRLLWQTTDQFAQVPSRLRWLRKADKTPQMVRATVGFEQMTRTAALVREFANARVFFRPEEHGFTDPRPNQTFTCYVSFGHNGPFLRPLSAPPPPAE